MCYLEYWSLIISIIFKYKLQLHKGANDVPLSSDVDEYGSGTHFTNDFSITIQIRRKFHSDLIQLLMIRSQQNLAHATTAQLSCHVLNIVAIT